MRNKRASFSEGLRSVVNRRRSSTDEGAGGARHAGFAGDIGNGHGLVPRRATMMPDRDGLMQMYRAPKETVPKTYDLAKVRQQLSSSHVEDDMGRRRRRFLLDPRTSHFLSRWDACTSVALIFTALVTPFEVAFLPESVVPIFVLNRLVDVCFAVDIGINFVTMVPPLSNVKSNDQRAATKWVDDPRAIALCYLRGWFTIDVVSVAVSAGDIASIAVEGRQSNTRVVSVFKVLRVLRIFRLSKKIDKLSSSKMFRIAQFTFMLIMAAHFYACFWFWIGGSAPPIVLADLKQSFRLLWAVQTLQALPGAGFFQGHLKGLNAGLDDEGTRAKLGFGLHFGMSMLVEKLRFWIAKGDELVADVERWAAKRSTSGVSVT